MQMTFLLGYLVRPKSNFVGKGSLIAHRRYCGDSCCELSLKLTLLAS